MSDRQLAGFVVREVQRQIRKGAGNDFGRVSEMTEDGRARIEVRPGKFQEVAAVEPVPPGQGLSVNRARGLMQGEGFSLYS